ncbi:MAG TPA: serine/threonine-protein kinase [Solirubrobacteraceae bacterium]|jgi:serine/threonine protein kinase|nr:serine/threonine-protein kinase [Solirubrobacteraceae bacterium]
MSPDSGRNDARVVGRYEIIEQLGKGGMATVHLARQADLERVVALKELDRFGTADEHVLASRFLREARLAGSLSHPNIVTVYEYFEHGARPFIAMEYVRGGSLRDYLGRLSLAQIAGVLEGLLASLTHAERHEIVHRDIKPENILVTDDGRVKITDFGVAKAYNSVVSGGALTATGMTIGTPTYMAPEQATGQSPISNVTDLYAVGVVAYEMLVGQVPFDSDEGQLALVWQHVHEPLPDPRSVRPDLDPRLCAWLVQLLEKEPAARPASAATVLVELEEIVLDLLGPRWRRDAPLPAPHAASHTPRPLTPARVDSRIEESAARTHASPLVDAVFAPTISPLAEHVGTEHFRRAERDPPATAPPPPTSTDAWSISKIVLVVALPIVALACGFLLFAGEEDRPRPPVSTAAPASAAAAERFAGQLARGLSALDRVRLQTRRRLAAALTARAQAARARTIASAYRTAAAALARLSPTPEQRDEAAVVADKLALAAGAYDALAAAAESRRAVAYEAQRRAITVRESAVRRAVSLVPGFSTVAGPSGAP